MRKKFRRGGGLAALIIAILVVAVDQHLNHHTGAGTTGAATTGTYQNRTEGNQQNADEVIDKSATAQGNLVPVVVTKVTDGDTIHVRMPDGEDKTIRMLLIDTPEDVKPNTPVEPFALDAAAFARQELPVGKQIYIEEGKPGYTTDKYGRLLAYVYITKTDMYNEDVVRKGLARVAYIYPPNTDHLAELEADQSYAKAHHLGIWTIPGYVTSKGYDLDAAKKWQGAN
ncbi:thermonuclease family protein [Alicyclobacillus acidoterrestris]|uniref:Thermonuclease family protein n=1 Tax=Alicyclobacillus acidoterrestris (strain ATCC 49025 / DSM 3922 / CIP 106132 / NCIMB 13137 / GD3B) TaxID=1356854 RepID=T0BRD2_ALIAG|nr:thermonuclease family protein [Alicyclobacillus acidoterrestris]EPZ43070.1 hypothetical protein N007_01635 [Alicyclobacillus acidoterrestris ATCC 49025]UNO49862.1 thermonuclease family protein [Alicyclobacillus acidoterrestris]